MAQLSKVRSEEGRKEGRKEQQAAGDRERAARACSCDPVIGVASAVTAAVGHAALLARLLVGSYSRSWAAAWCLIRTRENGL